MTAELVSPAPHLDTLPGLHDLEVDGPRVSCPVDAEHLDGLMRALVDVGIRSLTSRPPSLEELFLAHYRPAEPIGAVR